MPAEKAAWPPAAWKDIYRAYRSWDAWYSGDPERLTAVYGADTGTGASARLAGGAGRGGVLGRLQRWFWGTPTRDQQRSVKLHVPAAGDLAGTSADLLFADPPTLRVDDSTDAGVATQARLEELLDATFAELAEAAEVCAALSGVFLRVGYDREVVPDRPLLSAVHPDAAIPVFRWGRLAEVTFHRVLVEDDGQVLRHLEHHEPGRVVHGLFLGDKDSLGRAVPLTEHESTADLVDSLSDDGQSIPTGLDELDVVYVPNARPNRAWRNHPVGSRLGQSDLAGLEGLMDALDESYTSWMRDVRLAKMRLLVPQSYLDNLGRGQGAAFDADREVFTGLEMLVKDGAGITPNQFAIRHAEHKATCDELWEKIVRGAGYSAQTFGLTGEVAMTATESVARERRTHLTRGKKARLWKPGIAKVAELMLQLDRAHFGHTEIEPQAPNVEFAPAVVETRAERAQTARMLADAEAASVATRVRIVHPEWDDDRVNNEVAAITAAAAPLPEMRV